MSNNPATTTGLVAEILLRGLCHDIHRLRFVRFRGDSPPSAAFMANPKQSVPAMRLRSSGDDPAVSGVWDGDWGTGRDGR